MHMLTIPLQFKIARTWSNRLLSLQNSKLQKATYTHVHTIMRVLTETHTMGTSIVLWSSCTARDYLWEGDCIQVFL